MTLNRRIGLGVTLGVDTTGGTGFVALGAIVDGLKDGGAKARTANVSILADKYEQYAKSQINPGEVTFMIAYDPDDTTSSTLVTAFKSVNQQTIPNWQITYPTGTQGAGTHTTESFLAHLIGMGREIKVDKLITCEITLQKTGDPGFFGD